MDSQPLCVFKRRQGSPRAAVAATLSIALLLSAAGVAVIGAPASRQDRREAARKVFAEGERLREQGTADSARAAVEKYQSAIKLMREAGDREGEGLALATLGFTLQFLLRRQEQAVVAYEQALVVFRESGSRREEGALLYNLGTAYLSLSRYDRAVESCERALTVQGGLGDRSAEGRALEGDTHGCLGEARERLGQYEQAIESSTRALTIYRELGRREQEAVLLSNLGALYSSLGRYDLAAEHYRQALALYRIAAPREGGTARRNEGTTLANLGFAFHKLGQIDKAVEHYEQALAVHRATDDARQEANTLTKLALARLEQGRSAEAVETSRRALAVHRELKDRFGEGRALDVLGRAYRALGKTEQSLEQLRASLAAMRETGARAGEAAALGELMLTYRARGATRLAVFYGKQSVNAYQDIRRDIRRLDRESREAFVGSKQDSYRTLAGLLVAQGRLAEAQQVLAMLKEDEYFEFVRRDGGDAAALTARAALSPEEAASERRYREIADRVAEVGRRWGALAAKQSRTPEEARELAELERDLEAANRAFQRFLDRVVNGVRGHEASRQGLSTARGRGAEGRAARVGRARGRALHHRRRREVSRHTLHAGRAARARVHDQRRRPSCEGACFPHGAARPAARPAPARARVVPDSGRAGGERLRGRAGRDADVVARRRAALRADGGTVASMASAIWSRAIRNVVFTPASIPGLTQPVSRESGPALGLGVSKARRLRRCPTCTEELRTASFVIRPTRRLQGRRASPGKIAARRHLHARAP